MKRFIVAEWRQRRGANPMEYSTAALLAGAHCQQDAALHAWVIGAVPGESTRAQGYCFECVGQLAVTDAVRAAGDDWRGFLLRNLDVPFLA